MLLYPSKHWDLLRCQFDVTIFFFWWEIKYGKLGNGSGETFSNSYGDDGYNEYNSGKSNFNKSTLIFDFPTHFDELFISIIKEELIYVYKHLCLLTDK